MRPEQIQTTAFRIIIPFGKTFFRFDQTITNNAFLFLYQLLDPWFMNMELLVFTTRHRAGDDQGRSCIIDQNGVYLIYHGIMVLALHHLFSRVYHVVAEIIETEFI